MSKAILILNAALCLLSCRREESLKPVSLTQLWYAHKSSVGFMNLERMALDLRADSSYRFYTRLAPIPPSETGNEIEEAGRFNVRGDTLFFAAEYWSGKDTSYYYARQYRLLPDTAEWPLRIKMRRGTTDFEIYFQALPPHRIIM